jgi:hypothetical protein
MSQKPGLKHLSYQAKFEFDNGYGASVISTPYSYGGIASFFEVAVEHDKHLCYATPVTSDVLGWLEFGEVAEALEQIEALPANPTCSHQRSEDVE